MDLNEDAVKFIRMNTGEDIIAQVMEMQRGEEHYYTLYNPMKVLYLTDKEGYMTVSLMQWVFYRIVEDQQFMVYPGDVVTVGTPTEKMKSNYWDAVKYYNDILQEKKRLAAMAEETEYLTEDITDNADAVDDNEGLDMITEFLNGLKKSGKGTLH